MSIHLPQGKRSSPNQIQKLRLCSVRPLQHCSRYQHIQVVLWWGYSDWKSDRGQDQRERRELGCYGVEEIAFEYHQVEPSYIDQESRY